MSEPRRTTRGPYANTAAQRDKILQGALVHFGRYGYWGSSMREIAREVGMSQATMRHHFPTKTALLTAVLDERDRATATQLVRDRAASGSRVDALASVMADNAGQPAIVRLFTTLAAEATAAEHPAHDFFAQRYQRVASNVAVLLQEAKDGGEIDASVDVRTAARVVLAVMLGLQVQWLLDPSVDMVALFRDHLARSLAPPSRRDTTSVGSPA